MKKESIKKVNMLAERIHRGDNKAWTDMYNELNGLKRTIVGHYTQKYNSFNIASADLEEAFDMALVQAINHYKFDDEKAEAPFFYYFQTAANMECRAVLRKAKADKRKIFCDYTSFSCPSATNKDGDSVTIGDAIPDTFKLEDSVLSEIETTPQIKKALDSLKQKDADIIRIHILYTDKKERKEALQNYLSGVKDATIRKNVQRARERFAKALTEVGYTEC